MCVDMKTAIDLEKLKLAVIVDSITKKCLSYECTVIALDSNWYIKQIEKYNPDLLLVETVTNNSAWEKQLLSLRNDNNNKLKDLTECCKKNNIPTVFFYKNGVKDIEKYIKIVKLFDYVFTIDTKSFNRYKKILNNNNIYMLFNSIQPAIHKPYFWNKSREKSSFFKSIDKNSIVNNYINYDWNIINRLMNKNRYTEVAKEIFEIISEEVNIINAYIYGVKVLFNSTRFRRLNKIIKDKEISDRLDALILREVLNKYTYKNMLAEIIEKTNIKSNIDYLPGVSIIIGTKRPYFMNNVFENFSRQNYRKKELIIVLNNNEMDIKKWKEKAKFYGDNIKVLQIDEKFFLGDCLNYAIENSKYEFISKFDDDDFYNCEYIRDLMNCFKYTNASIVGKQAAYFYFEKNNSLAIRNSNEEYKFVKMVMGSTITFKKSGIRNTKFLHTSKGEDYRFCIQNIEKGVKIFSSDRFNHTVCRREDVKSHTWRVSKKKLMRECEFIKYTKDFKDYVGI
ncbi:glycosyltransferase [Haloimpatiens sp. FM7330]|uniref:glycosyltransferase n=1 Tax=Haloimpatiens sp. FM7330 TaxID=3298610 RepID=UPI0036409DC0